MVGITDFSQSAVWIVGFLPEAVEVFKQQVFTRMTDANAKVADVNEAGFGFDKVRFPAVFQVEAVAVVG